MIRTYSNIIQYQLRSCGELTFQRVDILEFIYIEFRYQLFLCKYFGGQVWSLNHQSFVFHSERHKGEKLSKFTAGLRDFTVTVGSKFLESRACWNI